MRAESAMIYTGARQKNFAEIESGKPKLATINIVAKRAYLNNLPCKSALKAIKTTEI